MASFDGWLGNYSMRWRIRYQLLVPLLILFVGVIGVSVGAAFHTAARARQGIEARVREVARILNESPQFPLVAPVLEQMKKLSGADFLLLGDNHRVSTLESAPSELPAAEAIVDDWKTLRLGPPVEVAGKAFLCSGVRLRPPREGDTLYILYPEALWRDARWEALWPVLALGGSVGLAAIALAIGLGQRLSHRVTDLERRTRLIAAGDFSPMPLPKRDDEVRDLAQSVNEMAQQLAQYQDAVRRTERLRLLGQVSAGLAHQLRNGLTGARLAVQVFLREHDEVPDQEALQVALRQLTLLETNLKRFLDLGRQDRHRREPCSLGGLVNEALELLRPGCRHAGIELSWHAPLGETTVIGDAGALGQMILNVVSNAVEAAGPGGAVRVAIHGGPNKEDARGNGAFHPPAFYELEVKDSGPGPSVEVAPRLFEPFVTGKAEGVGLGLAVARQVAEAHSGKISWMRKGPWTCFRVDLPVAPGVVNQSGAV